MVTPLKIKVELLKQESYLFGENFQGAARSSNIDQSYNFEV